MPGPVTVEQWMDEYRKGVRTRPPEALVLQVFPCEFIVQVEGLHFCKLVDLPHEPSRDRFYVVLAWRFSPNTVSYHLQKQLHVVEADLNACFSSKDEAIDALTKDGWTLPRQ